jgi:hypothetical protein
MHITGPFSQASNAQAGEHVDATSLCRTCIGHIEHVAGIPDPYWRHTGLANLDPPHPARPRPDAVRYRRRGNTDNDGADTRRRPPTVRAVARVAHTPDDVPGDIDMDAVVAYVEALGHRAFVEQTGGGVATIYAGRRAPDTNGDLRWSAAAGPGWFEGPGFRRPRADTCEFYIGPDDDGEATPACPARGASAEEIARMIVAVIEHDTRPLRRVRYLIEVAATYDPDDWLDRLRLPAGTIGTYVRAHPATGPDWIWTVVDVDGRLWWVPVHKDMYEPVET